MEETLLLILNYLLAVFISTLTQVFILFGPLLILAILMHFITKQNQKLSFQVLGNKVYLYVFGWLGVSAHELGHAIFAILFGHRIVDMKLFTPKSTNGNLGYVSHSYTQSSIYQTVGNFFIGIGPILFGSIFLYFITYLLFQFSTGDITQVQITAQSFTSLESLKVAGQNIWSSLNTYINLVFFSAQSAWWKIVLLVYFLYSIGSSITLSRPDIQSAKSGFLYFILILALFNLATLWIGDFTAELFNKISIFFSGFYFLIVLSILINLVFIVILTVLKVIKSIVMGKRYE